VNVTLTTHVAPIASVPPQVFAEIVKSPKFVPVKSIVLSVSVALPVFVTVVDIAPLVTVTAVFGKVIEVGLKPMPATPPAPVPLTGTLCGLPDALSVNTIAEDRAPVEVGLKTTETVHVPPLEATLAQPVGVGTKSPAFVPCETIEVIRSAALPEFVIVMTCGAEVVPTVCELKVRLLGEGEKLAVGVTPVPDSATVCGDPAALSATLTFAVLLPLAVGVNFTEI
jgi:hypothetical protein